MLATRPRTPVCAAVESRHQAAHRKNHFEIQTRRKDVGRRRVDEVPESAEPTAADVPNVRIPEGISGGMPTDGARLVAAHGAPGVVRVEDEVQGGVSRGGEV